MAIKTKDVVVYLDGEGNLISAKGKNTIRIVGNYDKQELIDNAEMNIEGNALKVGYGGKTLTVTDYTGIKYVKFNDGQLFDLIEQGVINNNDIITGYNTKKLTATGTNYNDEIDLTESGYVAPTSGKNKNKGLTINSGNGHDSITATAYNDVINGGNGDDTITGGTGNDTITGGAGENTVIYNKGDGDDVVYLTKGENFTLEMKDFSVADLLDDSNIFNFEFVNKNKDLKISYDIPTTAAAAATDESIKGSITLKNFVSKDVTNNSNSKKGIEDTSSVNLKLSDRTINLREAIVVDSDGDDNFLYGADVESNYTGTWLNEYIGVDEEFKLWKKVKVGKKYETFERDVTDKGLVLNGAGGNDMLEGTKYSDTIKGGSGDDTINGGTGNDVITGEAGKNTIVHYIGDGDDVVYLTKGENFTLIIESLIEGTSIDWETLDYEFVNKNKDLKISYDIPTTAAAAATATDESIKGSITLKNFVSKDVTNNSNSKKGIEDTSSVELVVGGNEIDLREAIIGDSEGDNNYLYCADVESNYTGTWLNEYIDASEAELTKRVKVGKKYQDEPKSAEDKGLVLKGNGGDDAIIGSNYSDTIYGGAGDDLIEGGTGNDKLYGEDGKNIFAFNAGDGHDTIYSGKGEDTLTFEDMNLSELKFTQGTGKNNKDLVIKYNTPLGSETFDSVTLKDYYTVDKKGVITGVNSKNSVKYINTESGTYSMENILFGSGNVNGTDTTEVIIGSDSNDIITPGKNTHVIIAGDGKDSVSISPNYENDDMKIYLGDGYGKTTTLSTGNNVKIDNLYVDSVNCNSEIKIGGNNTITDMDVYLGSGKDTLEFSSGSSGCSSDNIYVNCGAGNDTINASSLTANSSAEFIGGSGTDSIYGSKGNDLIYGDQTPEEDPNHESAYSDTLYGNYGSDTIYGGGENDIIAGYNKDSFDGKDATNGTVDCLYGEAGNDKIYAQSETNYVDGGTGNDTINAFIDQTTYITDSDGNDSLVIYYNQSETYNIVFEVDKAGNISDDSLRILNKDNYNKWLKGEKLTAQINIKGSYDSIENIYLSAKADKTDISSTDVKKYITIDKINSIKEAVSGWLADTGYDDIDEVFTCNDEEDIAEMCAAFTNANNSAWQVANA